SVQEQDAYAYERDLRRLNELAGWSGEAAQVSHLRSATGEAVLAPPKFFCGDPGALDEMFVAAVSLNHAIPSGDMFDVELRDQQNEEDCFLAHRDYFSREYVYKKFFGARARVLHAYATQIGRSDVPALEDWPALNRRFALYIEAFPTRSRRF